MRKRHLEVFDDWSNYDENTKYDSVWTDGSNIYSYKTCILADCGYYELVVNTSRYSHTTTEIQNNLLTYLDQNVITTPITVNDAPKGISADNLVDMVLHKSPIKDYIRTFYKVAAP